MENIKPLLGTNEDLLDLSNISRDSQIPIWYSSYPYNISPNFRHMQSAISSKELEFLDDNIFAPANWLERYPELDTALLGEFLPVTVEQLSAFAASTGFSQKMSLAFGDSLLNRQLTNLQNGWLEDDYWVLPDIKILPGEQLNGSFGAFAQATNTIYLSQDYIDRNATNPAAISSVLLEEVGHFVDAKLNFRDTPGDEGAIFAALVQRSDLDEATLKTLKAKDDGGAIEVEGMTIQVEQATADTIPNSGSGENIVFPSDAGVLNVLDFGAKGDGVTDDTAAIQAALNAFPNGKRIIYLPNGTYLVSKTLNWPAGTPDTGDDFKNTILQGQSEGAAIIKLADGASDFNDPNIPQPVIFTGPAPAQRFGNSIRNLTVDTGINNPGAIGIQFNASNQGSMRQVTIQSGDGQGVNGLDMDFADEIGPLLVKDLTVRGFQYGIVTGYRVNSQAFENIHLENQSVYGFWNFSQVVNIRNLTSNNTVTAVYNGVGNTGHMTLIDSTLNSNGGAAGNSAIVNDGTLLARNITTSGYQAALQSEGNALPGSNISEFVSGAVASQFPSPTQTLNLPIRETPEVPWDDPSTTPWANVVSYGAVPNDGRDDTAAIQAAIDSGSTTVYLPVGNYDLQDTVLIRNNARRIIGTEAFVEVPDSVNPGFKVVEGNNPIVVFERISSGFNPTPTIENASVRTLVIRDGINVSGTMTGSGDVFIENVVSSPFSNWTFNGQNVWARQLNVENEGTHITNNGGNLWILGLKTERGGTIIDTRGGGKTELLGGLIYTTTGGPDNIQSSPMFINNESSVSISAAEVNFAAPAYPVYVQETRDGITRTLMADNLPDYVSAGKDIPLYVGY
jgi:hypothetical protein